jgi:hypothetical protein
LRRGRGPREGISRVSQGSEETQLLFLLLLLPLGHAVELLLGFPKDVLEVRI